MRRLVFALLVVAVLLWLNGCTSLVGEYVGPKELRRQEHCEEATRLARDVGKVADVVGKMINGEIPFSEDEFSAGLELGAQLNDAFEAEAEACLGPLPKKGTSL
jgi:cytochrome c556